MVAAVDAVFIGGALFVLGVPLALPLAAVVFIGAFIPLVGATLAGAVATLVALVTNGPVTALIVLGVVVLVNQLEGNLLQPVVMGNTLSVHPLVILIALTAGTVLAGIIGAVLSVPLTAVAWAGIKAWNAERDEDITDDEVESAEIRTLMDEQGRGPSTLGEDTGSGEDSAEYSKVRAHAALLQERRPVASRQEALDAAHPTEDEDGHGDDPDTLVR